MGYAYASASLQERGEESVGYEVLDMRIDPRVGRDCRGRASWIGDRDEENSGLDCMLPSAFCGVIGADFGQYRGRVSWRGAMALSYSWTRSGHWRGPRKIAQTFSRRLRVTNRWIAAHYR